MLGLPKKPPNSIIVVEVEKKTAKKKKNAGACPSSLQANQFVAPRGAVATAVVLGRSYGGNGTSTEKKTPLFLRGRCSNGRSG